MEEEEEVTLMVGMVGESRPSDRGREEPEPGVWLWEEGVT